VVRVGAGIRTHNMFVPYLGKTSKSPLDDGNESNLHAAECQEVEGIQLSLDTV
jgi:hypothetical protein